MRRISVLIVLLAVPAGFSVAQRADAIFTNAKIWTVDSLHPRAQAVAVLSGKILAVGSDAEIRKLAGPATAFTDVKGKLMLPGFIDDHTHFMGGGFQLGSVNLREAANGKEFADIIAARAKKDPGRWITGGDWDHDRWPGGELPSRVLIDKFTQTTPVFVSRYDGHMALANSFVLHLVGITRQTPDPPGGTIVRDPGTGEPTGILKDAAMDAVYSLIPASTAADMLEAARRALAEAKKYGVTSIQDVSSPEDLRVYQELEAKGELTLRIHCRMPITMWENMSGLGIKVPFGDEYIRIGSLKAFADGSLGSSTALFFDPYVSDTSTRGLATDIVQNGALRKWALGADRAGLQLSIHAIGDSAVSLLLDLFGTIVKENPPWDRRFRIEHAQHIREKDFRRFAALGVIASAQPYHAIDDGRWAEKRIGKERCRWAYPFRTFIDSGVKLCFGSDWTVAPIDPLIGIYAAVTRRTIDGANPGGWFPEEKISVGEAIEAYTVNNAYAAFEENEKGSISPGKLADLVVLSGDILTIDPARIDTVRVEMTVVGGKIVYQRQEPQR